MKALIGFVLVGFLFVSCHKNEECCTIIDVGITIKYIDADANNILDTTDGINASEIKLYYKNNDEWNYYFDGNMDFSKGFQVFTMEGEKYLKLFPSDIYYDEIYSETKIAYSENDFDILKCEFYFNKSNIFCTKIWLNDSLAWDQNSNNADRMIEIIK
jgi:hypothetical protein